MFRFRRANKRRTESNDSVEAEGRVTARGKETIGPHGEPSSPHQRKQTSEQKLTLNFMTLLIAVHFKSNCLSREVIVNLQEIPEIPELI